MVAANEKGEEKWGRLRDDNLRLRPTINVFFLGRWPGLAAIREQHSVHMVSYCSIIKAIVFKLQVIYSTVRSSVTYMQDKREITFNTR